MGRAARTATDFVRATLDEPRLSVGIVLCIQTHGSLLNWQPHIHALVTDGGYRPDGTFVRRPAHTDDVLTEAFRRGILKLFVERELFEPEVADSMLDWLHSVFSVHYGVWLDQDDAPAHKRLALSCARYPVCPHCRGLRRFRHLQGETEQGPGARRRPRHLLLRHVRDQEVGRDLVGRDRGRQE